MFKVVVLFLFYSSVCYADIHVEPPHPPRVICGETPSKMYRCMGNPTFINMSTLQKCKGTSDSCERSTCSVRESGWLTADGKIDKQKVTLHLDEFAKDHPSRSAAVAHAKATCLGADLPAQGIYLNCPAYDLMTCILSAFIKNVNPSDWRNEESCAYARDYARACPVCPDECFATSIPIGSCNACRSLPRTP